MGRLWYWRSGNSAEVDFIFEDDINRIIPAEVKAADHTRAKSFVTYCKQYRPQLGLRISGKNVGDNDKQGTHEINLPLFLLWRLQAYLSEGR